MTFKNWLNTFISEKGLDLEHVFEVKGVVWGVHNIPLGVVVEHMYQASPKEQAAIKDMVVRIDFRNGDVMDFFKHLAKAVVANYERGQ